MPQQNNMIPELQAIKQHRIVIIYRGLQPEECLEVSRVLYDAGIRLFEVTMNSDDTTDSIQRLHSRLKSDAYIGAGTVLDTEQVEAAYDAGARYIISPNTNVDVIKRTKELGMVSVPGAMTPTEVELAYKSGGDIIKVFPINVFGAKFITQLKGPLDHIDYLACGGLTLSMVKDLFKAGCTAMGLGVQLLGEDLVEQKDWETLSSRATNLVKTAEY